MALVFIGDSIGILVKIPLPFVPLTKFFAFNHHGRNSVRELEFRFKYLPTSTYSCKQKKMAERDSSTMLITKTKMATELSRNS